MLAVVGRKLICIAGRFSFVHEDPDTGEAPKAGLYALVREVKGSELRIRLAPHTYLLLPSRRCFERNLDKKI